MTPAPSAALTATCPASRRRPTPTARPTSLVHTEATSPYSVPLATSTASSSSSTVSTDKTGPNISSWAMRMLGSTRSNSVASTKYPASYCGPAGVPPPVTTSAPSARPSRTAAGGPPAGRPLGASRAPEPHVVGHAGVLLGVDEGAHLDLLVPRADSHPF